MSITALMNRVDILSEYNYMWHGQTLSENYGATEEMMNEFWELVAERIDEAYMKEPTISLMKAHVTQTHPLLAYVGFRLTEILLIQLSQNWKAKMLKNG